MRELHYLEDESTETFYVLRDNDGVRYQLARAELPAPSAAAAVAGHAGLSGLSGLSGAADADIVDAEVVDDTFDADDADGVELSGDAELAQPAQTEQLAQSAEPAQPERSLPEPDPLYATPLSLRPNEIQAKIRGGASTAELAEEMGVAESRIESYAHPVLLERAQIAEAAKQSHPVREDGPAKLTLFEILATSFAARGHSISDATWDATREPGDDWVVHVTWQAGLTENEALWSFKRSMGSAPRTEARNAMAADLTDPNFAQPVRSLTSVGNIGAYRGDQEYGYAGDDSYDEYDEIEAAQHGEPGEHREPGGDQDPLLDADSAGASRTFDDDEVLEGDFLRHPDEGEQPQKRRRKAVTPHWEDVLLGVRTNTKRPKR